MWLLVTSLTSGGDGGGVMLANRFKSHHWTTPMEALKGLFFSFFKFVWWPILYSSLDVTWKRKKKKIPSYCLFSYMKNKIRRSDLNYGSAAEINISPLATHRFCIQLCLRCEMLLFFFRKVFSKLQEDLIYYCQSVKIDWDKTYNYNKGRNYRFNFWRSSVVISCQQSLTRCKNQPFPSASLCCLSDVVMCSEDDLTARVSPLNLRRCFYRSRIETINVLNQTKD